MANLIDTLQTGLEMPNAQISFGNFLMNLVLAGICAWVLEHFFVRFGNSLSNRTLLARNFMLITLTTTLIITIVKSSLALSLGLVGALSIVRFRTAVKEPEELAYLFFAISLGLGFGANQTMITLMAFIIILLIVSLHRIKNVGTKSQVLMLTVGSPKPREFNVNELIKAIKPYCHQIDLKRQDEEENTVELGCYVDFKNLEAMHKSFQAIRKLLPKAKITSIDQSKLML